jgi:hypothetical protein
VGEPSVTIRFSKTTHDRFKTVELVRLSMGRMKTILMLSILLVATESKTRAQNIVCAFGAMSTDYIAMADQPATPHAAKDLKRLLSMLCPKGCGRVEIFKNATAPNELMVNIGNGSSKIAYSPAFLEKVASVYGPDATLAVLAHEFGHHVDLNGNVAAWMNDTWGNELRADAWTGCALAKAGLKTQGLKGALRAVAAYPSNMDPAWDLRSVAVEKGFSSCGGTFKLATLEPKIARGPTGGCGGDTDCKTGRVCLDGRCQDRPAGNCSKDVDCPGNQVCAPAGRCDGPSGPGVTAEAAAADSVHKFPQIDCHKQCESQRRVCRVGAVRALNECLGRVTTAATYKACTCPNWPAARADCRQTCEDGFEKAEQCEANYAATREGCQTDATACATCS